MTEAGERAGMPKGLVSCLREVEPRRYRRS